MSQNDKVGGTLRLSVPFQGAKGKVVYTTVESSFEHNTKDNTTEERNKSRDEGWDELVVDIQKRISTIVNPIQEDLAGV